MRWMLILLALTVTADAAAYRLTSGAAPTAQPVIRTADGVIIPNDPGNMDYQAYRKWLAVPNIPDMAIAPTAVPSNPGVTCSGVPTALFAVTNGIVTHC
jgi:hypothetical protein